MKKKHFIVGTIIICIFIVIFLVFYHKQNITNTVSYDLNGHTYHLLTAKTPPEWEKGLMYAKTLPSSDGMIFLFPDSKPRSFWNKNTYVDLDLYWINQGKVVNKSYLPSIEKKGQVIVSSDAPVDTVIELLRK